MKPAPPINSTRRPLRRGSVAQFRDPSIILPPSHEDLARAQTLPPRFIQAQTDSVLGDDLFLPAVEHPANSLRSVHHSPSFVAAATANRNSGNPRRPSTVIRTTSNTIPVCFMISGLE